MNPEDRQKIDDLSNKVEELTKEVSDLKLEKMNRILPDNLINSTTDRDSTQAIRKFARDATITEAIDAATITFGVAAQRIHQVTLGGNRTLAVLGAEKGHVFFLNLKQDGTGSRTVTWFSGISWAGGAAPTLSTAAGKMDTLGFLCLSTSTFIGFVVGQNI
jgi:hypothetical protein